MRGTKELIILHQLLLDKTPLTAMLAPSFPIDFSYPQIVGKLKRLGFKYVVDVGAGANETNRQLVREISQDKTKRVITSPCPNAKAYIRSRYHELLPYLSQADSPMIATAKLVRQHYPETKPVFIGPCLVKKLEALQNPELAILAITFKDLANLLQEAHLTDQPQDHEARFDSWSSDETKLYPISGGLAQSAGLSKILAKDEYLVVSGPQKIDGALIEFSNNPKIRVLDLLFCYGGCIAGLGISSPKSLAERRDIILKFWNKQLSSQNDLEKF